MGREPLPAQGANNRQREAFPPPRVAAIVATRAQQVPNYSLFKHRRLGGRICLGARMVGGRGIEPLTPSMSITCTGGTAIMNWLGF
jgi:hypothetical protein